MSAKLEGYMPGSRSRRARGAKPSRSAVNGLKPEPSARRCAPIVRALKAESKTHSELNGKVSGLVIEMYHVPKIGSLFRSLIVL